MLGFGGKEQRAWNFISLQLVEESPSSECLAASFSLLDE
jgi:hypothetical protein